MRDCCGATADRFDAKTAEKRVRRLEREGPDRTTRMLVDALRQAGVEGRTVLDVGGGAGAIPEALLGAGAAGVTYTEASRAYMEAARERGARRGWGDRVDYRVGDFVALARTLDDADIVTLDRVLCCDPDAEAMTSASARKAKRLWGAVYPRERWSVRAVIALMNLWRRLRGSDFRVWVHPIDGIHAVLRRAGFRPRSVARTFVWEVAVFERADAAAG